MHEPRDSNNQVQETAKEYFTYLGKNMPQQCASDEFYFMPRSQYAVPFLNELDDFSPDRILDHTRHVETLRNRLPAGPVGDLEGEIDHGLLKMSMDSFLREFRDAEVWRSDPTLYVKIPLLATARAMSGQDAPDACRETLEALFSQIPSFLARAGSNLVSPSKLFIGVAGEMIQDAIHFFGQDVPLFLEMKTGGDERLQSRIQGILSAWSEYQGALRACPQGIGFAVGEEGLGALLSKNLSCDKTPGEVLEIAENAYNETLESIQALVAGIGRHKDWETLRAERIPLVSSPEEALALYRREVQSLRNFFAAQDIITYPPGESVEVLETPVYLRSLRATASYQAPLTGRGNERGIFFITPGEGDLELMSGHCPYLSAHETYPGHHILDHIRIHHPNPVRRQIESPLFYEGWACYGEQLLDELGYITDPRQQLIQLERQLWRCLRAMLDVRLQTGGTGLEQGQRELEKLGFSSSRAQRQIRRFAMTPGYQSCYFLGNHEIQCLRETYAPKIGLREFHDVLLEGGEIPFLFAEMRLKAASV